MARTSRLKLGLSLLVLGLATTVGCTPLRPTKMTVWVVGDNSVVHPDSQPDTENDIFSATNRHITLNAAVNETIAFQVVARVDHSPTRPYDIRVTNLKSEAHTLPADEVFSLFRADTVLESNFPSWYSEHTQRPPTPSKFFDILVPWQAPQGGGPIQFKDGDTELVWVDLSIPPTAEPGTYTGKIGVVSAKTDAPVFVAQITLRVHPVAIPTEPTLSAICRVDPRELLATHLNWPTVTAEQTRLLPELRTHHEAIALTNAAMRLLQSHRTNPVLWASFPKFEVTNQLDVNVDWEPYAKLVSPWVDGSAYDNRVASRYWLVPASLSHPNANGSVQTPQYARTLGSYLNTCKTHFADENWTAEPIVCPMPQQPMTAHAIDNMTQIDGIMRQQQIDLPLVAHFPVQSLSGLGWFGAPTVDLPGVDIWAPPARWAEPMSLERMRNMGKDFWLMPDFPPYSSTIGLLADNNDIRSLGWLAYRYDASSMWIEHAADTAGDAFETPLIYPGKPYGLSDRPVASIRLKRLRRSLLDHDLLALLAKNNMPALASRLSKQVIRYGLTDAARENLLSTMPAGWSRSPTTLRMAHRLILQELTNRFEPTADGSDAQFRTQAEWQLLLSDADRVIIEPRGVRLVDEPSGIKGKLFVDLLNLTRDSIAGRWELIGNAAAWGAAKPEMINIPVNGRRSLTVDLAFDAISYNQDGVQKTDARFTTDEYGDYETVTRLAVSTAPLADTPLSIDGDLSDWPVSANNSAGDFFLCRGVRPIVDEMDPRSPSLPTRAYFCTDRDFLYIAVLCALPRGERPMWRADNIISVDGGIPWGQDLVEIILSPENVVGGTSSDLYLLQIKPSGLVVSHKGCPTDPPTGDVQPWNADARVAVGYPTNAWTVEIAIPLDSLGSAARTSRIFGLNVTRLDAKRGEYSSWSGAKGNCYSPNALGNVILQGR